MQANGVTLSFCFFKGHGTLNGWASTSESCVGLIGHLNVLFFPWCGRECLDRMDTPLMASIGCKVHPSLYFVVVQLYLYRAYLETFLQVRYGVAIVVVIVSRHCSYFSCAM